MNPSPEKTRYLGADDFRFVFRRPPNVLTRPTPRPLRLIEGNPGHRSVEHARFIPASPNNPSTGAIYDAQGYLIPESRITRGLSDTSDPSVAGHSTIRPTARRRGNYIYLGHLMPHFGHFITETLSTLWILRERLGRIDGYVAHAHHASTLGIRCVKDFLSYANVDLGTLITPFEPTEFDNLIVPQPSLQLESHVYDAYHDTCLWLADAAGIKNEEESTQPVFVSRKNLKKGVYYYAGQESLEEYFRRNGAKVIHPETLSTLEQLALFRRHTSFFGIVGSGLHNVVFSQRRPRIHYFTPRWINPTCFLLDAATGTSSTYVVATDRSDAIRSFTEKLGRFFPLLLPPKPERFHRERNLDSERVMHWLTGTGALAQSSVVTAESTNES